jgi:histone H3/H4
VTSKKRKRLFLLESLYFVWSPPEEETDPAAEQSQDEDVDTNDKDIEAEKTDPAAELSQDEGVDSNPGNDEDRNILQACLVGIDDEDEQAAKLVGILSHQCDSLKSGPLHNVLFSEGLRYASSFAHGIRSKKFGLSDERLAPFGLTVEILCEGLVHSFDDLCALLNLRKVADLRGCVSAMSLKACKPKKQDYVHTLMIHYRTTFVDPCLPVDLLRYIVAWWSKFEKQRQSEEGAQKCEEGAKTKKKEYPPVQDKEHESPLKYSKFVKIVRATHAELVEASPLDSPLRTIRTFSSEAFPLLQRATEVHISRIIKDADTVADMVRSKSRILPVDLRVASARGQPGTLISSLEEAASNRNDDKFLGELANLPDATIKVFAYRVGVKTFNKKACDETRHSLKRFLNVVITETLRTAASNKRKRPTDMDVEHALKCCARTLM